MKIVYGQNGDSGKPVIATTANDADTAEILGSLVKVGKPFLSFSELPREIESAAANPSAGITCDFTDAPKCSKDVEANRSAISSMLANPPLGKVRTA